MEKGSSKLIFLEPFYNHRCITYCSPILLISTFLLDKIYLTISLLIIMKKIHFYTSIALKKELLSDNNPLKFIFHSISYTFFHYHISKVHFFLKASCLELKLIHFLYIPYSSTFLYSYLLFEF